MSEHKGMTIAGNGASELGKLMREQRDSRVAVYPDGNPNAALSQTMQPQAEPAAGEQAGAVASVAEFKSEYAQHEGNIKMWARQWMRSGVNRVAAIHEALDKMHELHFAAPGAAIAAREQEPCKTCGGTGNDPGGLPACRSCASLTQPTTVQQTAWDASDIKQPGWHHVAQAFIEGAREARANPDAADADFKRAADGYSKRVFEEIDPESEHRLRTGDFKGMQPGERKEKM